MSQAVQGVQVYFEEYFQETPPSELCEPTSLLHYTETAILEFESTLCLALGPLYCRALVSFLLRKHEANYLVSLLSVVHQNSIIVI